MEKQLLKINKTALLIALILNISNFACAQKALNGKLDNLFNYDYSLIELKEGEIEYAGGFVSNPGANSASLYIFSLQKKNKEVKEVESILFTPSNELFMSNSKFYINETWLKIITETAEKEDTEFKINLSRTDFGEVKKKLILYESLIKY